jgi:LysM repeat protein
LQYGDYLVALADRFGTTWQELAQLNLIGYPFTIFPGQVLQLPEGEAQEVQAEAPPETEPEPVESPPTINSGNYQMHLPMVQRNSVVLSTSPVVIAPILPEPAETVIVPSSTMLVIFSKSIGVDWHLLAELNDLHHPYLVHTGQVLQLR